MADTIRVVEYFYVETPNSPGVGAAMLSTLRDARRQSARVLGLSERPARADRLRARGRRRFRAAAKAAKWKLVGPKRRSW